jgi:hypothetical protein
MTKLMPFCAKMFRKIVPKSGKNSVAELGQGWLRNESFEMYFSAINQPMSRLCKKHRARPEVRRAATQSANPRRTYD